jgi:uncharacterized protein (UPF0210 family)
MKVRSITAFAPATASVEDAAAQAGAFLARARKQVTDTGVEVQTVRLALAPLGDMVRAEARPRQLVELSTRLEAACTEMGIDYVSLGPWRPGDPDHFATTIPEILGQTSRLFSTLAYASRDSGVDVHAAQLAAEVIVAAAPLEENGFANLRFAALANVDAGVPFLDLNSGADDLVRRIEEAGAPLVEASTDLATNGFRFGGLDFSLAPFPRDEDSIGSTLESMGVEACGLPGTAAASAILTSALGRAELPLTGFSGLFLPVLEDDRLARRAAEGDLRLEDLLLSSAVCGTGLDTVPLPGDTHAEDLLPWLLDLGALAVRLDKPLTARLMPMPGLEAGDPLEFDFPFFAAGAVMDLPRTRWTGSGSELPIRPRSRPLR